MGFTRLLVGYFKWIHQMSCENYGLKFGEWNKSYFILYTSYIRTKYGNLLFVEVTDAKQTYLFTSKSYSSSEHWNPLPFALVVLLRLPHLQTFVYSTIYLFIWCSYWFISTSSFRAPLYLRLHPHPLRRLHYHHPLLRRPRESPRGSGEGVFFVFVIFLLFFGLVPPGWAEILYQSISYKCIVRVSFLNFIWFRI